MKAQVKWQGAAKFEGLTETGHTIIMDGAQEYGGENQGARPMELLLIGMGGCSAFDVVLILKKSRQDIVDCVVDIDSERADSEPKVFTKIHAHFKISGRDLSEKQVARAVQLSAEKYCSASIMLGKTAEISHDFEIIEVE